jgi:hypothetical protein
MVDVATQQRQDGRKINRKRLALEKSVMQALNKWDDLVVANYKAALLAGAAGRYSITADDRDALQLLLDEHYQAVIDAFAPFVVARRTKKSAKADGEVTREVNNVTDQIISLLVALVAAQAPQHVNAIVGTTEDDAAAAYTEARELAVEEAAETGLPIAEATIIASAVRILRKRLASRVGIRAITETTWVAEGTRATEAQTVGNRMADALRREADAINADNQPLAAREAAVVGELADMTPSHDADLHADLADNGAQLMTAGAAGALVAIANNMIEQTKTWLTMLDNRVRPTHRQAEGQTVRVSDTFSVGKSQMLYPGDRSFGAPMDEIVNCRCYVYYS